MCNCRNEVKQKLNEKYSAEFEKVDVELSGGVTQIVNGEAISKGGWDVKINHIRVMKNGKLKRVYENTFFIFSYCPICGQKYEQNPANG